MKNGTNTYFQVQHRAYSMVHAIRDTGDPQTGFSGQCSMNFLLLAVIDAAVVLLAGCRRW
jgi:hypothetical protein